MQIVIRGWMLKKGLKPSAPGMQNEPSTLQTDGREITTILHPDGREIATIGLVITCLSLGSFAGAFTVIYYESRLTPVLANLPPQTHLIASPTKTVEDLKVGESGWIAQNQLVKWDKRYYLPAKTTIHRYASWDRRTFVWRMKEQSAYASWELSDPYGVLMHDNEEWGEIRKASDSDGRLIRPKPHYVK